MKKKWLIIAGIAVILLVIAVIIVTNIGREGDINSLPTVSGDFSTYTACDDENIWHIDDSSDNNSDIEPQETNSGSSIPEIDMNFLFGSSEAETSDVSETTGKSNNLSVLANNLDKSVIRLKFDNIELLPGKTARELVTGSNYHSNRDELIKPGETAFIVFESDKWDDDSLKLDANANILNTNFTVWVKNFNKTDTPVLDCIVYKYSINYSNSLLNYSDRPMFEYYNNYKLGKFNQNERDCVDYIELDNGNIRYEYGDIDTALIYLDFDSRYGLVGVTIAVNNFYGPEFELTERSNSDADNSDAP